MIEIAVGYLGAYLARKGLDVLARTGGDVDSAIDAKLAELYDWVKAKLTRSATSAISLDLLEESPEGDKQQALVTEQLTQAVTDDEEANGELAALVAELDRLRPAGISIRGLARAEDLHGTQQGVLIEGALPNEGEIVGEAHATTVHSDAKNVGVHIKNAP